jgi:hypothetical protein
MSRPEDTMSPDQPEKPDVVEDKHLCFLDALRESGVTNMFGASPYLQEAFDLSRADSTAILSYWMKTFSLRHPD